MIIYHTEERKVRKVFFNEKNLAPLAAFGVKKRAINQPRSGYE
jgi:hypothetical protein